PLVPMAKPAAEVVARAEGPPGAAYHDHLDVGRPRGLADRLLHLVGHRRDDGVELCRAVQRDGRDLVGHGVQDRLEGRALRGHGRVGMLGRTRSGLPPGAVVTGGERARPQAGYGPGHLTEGARSPTWRVR